MNTGDQNCLGQASISTEESGAAGRGVIKCVEVASNDDECLGHHAKHKCNALHELNSAADTLAVGNFITPQLVSTKMYDADEAASQRTTAVVFGSVVTIVVLGLIAVTWVSLTGGSPSGVTDYLRTVGIPLVTAAFSFLAGYKVRGRKVRH